MTERAPARAKLPGWVWGGLIGCAIIMSWMAWNKYLPATAAEIAQLEKRVGGEDVLNVIRNADRVYATRIQIKGNKEYWESLTEFEATSDPIPVSETDLEVLKTLLTSPRNYGFDPIGCRPRWGFRLTFLNGTDSLDIWVCLECHHMLFMRDGRELGGLTFSGMRREIKTLAIRLFPDDAAIAEAAK